MTVLWQPSVPALLNLQPSNPDSSQAEALGIPFLVYDESGQQIESRQVMAVHRLNRSNGEVFAAIVLRQVGAVETRHLLDTLTKQEMVVANLIADGLSTKAIAHSLAISQHTARHHTESVFRKLGVRSRVNVTSMVLGKRNSAAQQETSK